MGKKFVLVIGAGIAGLTAAYELTKQGVAVTVLEASGRVGGRMTTDRRDGYIIDRGAQFLSDGYRVLFRLAEELGLSNKLKPTRPRAGILHAGRIQSIDLRFPWTPVSSGLLSGREMLRLGLQSLMLHRAVRHLPLSDYSQWHRFDDEDAAEWVRACFGSHILEYVFEPMLEGFYFQEPEGMSRAWAMLVWSFLLRRKKMIALEGGIGSLPEAIAAKLTILLNTPVDAIDASGSRVRVITSKESFEADQVILAVPAPAAQALYPSAVEVERRLLSTPYSATINIAFALSKTVHSGTVPPGMYGLLIPRRERKVITAVTFESQKCVSFAPAGELMNVMLCGKAGQRLVHASNKKVLDEVLPELEHCFTGITRLIRFDHFSRWVNAEPCSPVGRSRDIHLYRRLCQADNKVILAGDYMSIPTTEGAAESGVWAAKRVCGV